MTEHTRHDNKRTAATGKSLSASSTGVRKMSLDNGVGWGESGRGGEIREGSVKEGFRWNRPTN